ncbi:MAG TPA: hypothetical protein VHC44_19725 [Verrucomicrobiae bacterium]|nr:hypothetical protein [Verrucomicrobiae bacterium]
MKKSNKPSGLIVLSIQSIHAQRIFSKTKLFELRKALPKIDFKRVYLYESGAARIIGCFDVGRILKLTPADLWTIVGENATTHERFNAYFANSKTACALEVLAPIKFAAPLYLSALAKQGVAFTPPVSSCAVSFKDKLAAILEAKRKRSLQSRHVELRQIRSSEEALYRKLVTEEIAPRYDEITAAFAQNILQTNRQGFDPNGIFTKGKEVFAIIKDKRTLVGFTTVTLKLGGSIKTGPTVLFKRYRGMGYGTATRKALEYYAHSRKARKLYCTSPDSDFNVISYLLGSDYRVEAHLQHQYSETHGEFVFGKRLRTSTEVRRGSHTRVNRVGFADAVSTSSNALVTAFHARFTSEWMTVPQKHSRAIINAAITDSRKTYEEKPVRLVGARAQDGTWLSFVLLVPKRGGAMKALLLTGTTNEATNRSIVHEAEQQGKALNKRKLYFCHAADDVPVLALLKELGYECEGVLAEPYRPNVDVMVLSKKLKSSDNAERKANEMLLPLGFTKT